MADTSDPQRPFWMRNLPIGLIALAAVFGALLLRDHLTFEALRDNREALIAFRDANYAVTALVFVLIYVLIVTFSLPGALVASLAGGFLFGVVHGSILNISAATSGLR